MFKELDMIIQEHCMLCYPLGPDDAEYELDDIKYHDLVEEINEHIQGKRKFEDLSSEAQEIMEEWERYENELRGHKLQQYLKFS